MDLSEIVPSSDEIEVTLVYPGTDNTLENDDGTPMVIALYAPHTKEYKSVMYALANERIKNKDSEMSVEDFEKHSIELISGVIKWWDITYNKEKPKLSKEKAKEILTGKAGFWISEQLQEKLNSFEAFTTA